MMLCEIFVMRHGGKDARQLTDNQWEDSGPAWQSRARAAARALVTRGGIVGQSFRLTQYLALIRLDGQTL